jgi:hypothetical protein
LKQSSFKLQLETKKIGGESKALKIVQNLFPKSRGKTRQVFIHAFASLPKNPTKLNFHVKNPIQL